MKKVIVTALAGMLMTAGFAAAQTASPAPVDPKIFPEAKTGYTRHILTIPEQASEQNFKIEIVAGQNMEVDCNQVMISADIDDENLEGWGYNYYKIDDISKPASTMMGCPDNSRTTKFIDFNMGNEALVRYNSKLPLVVYAPENIEVGYRVWQTDGKLIKDSK
jgi:ecotin